jgi:hypothetical protein
MNGLSRSKLELLFLKGHTQSQRAGNLEKTCTRKETRCEVRGATGNPDAMGAALLNLLSRGTCRMALLTPDKPEIKASAGPPLPGIQNQPLLQRGRLRERRPLGVDQASGDGRRTLLAVSTRGLGDPG